MRNRFVVVLLVASLGGCGEKRSEPAPAPTPVEKSAPIGDGTDDARGKVVSRTGQPLTLMARLTEESKSRPTGTPTVEQVLDALAAGGVPLAGPPKQYLAATTRASFCMGGATEKGMGVAVCEYADEEAARKGREYSLETFKAANPNRTIVVNKKTTLTLSTGAATEADVDAKKAVEIFERL